ncbi:MAG: diguanylate cyclase [Deltaproteobacteria bacterium]|nr:diguanylate cyclase [Deltaproteobacteria bacterium]
MSESKPAVDEPVQRVRRRIGTRLALVCAGAAIALGALALLLLEPVERSTVARVASDQVGLLAEAVAATYQVAPPRAHDDEPVDDEASPPAPERAHRAEEVLAQLTHAEGVEWIDVLDHEGRVQRSTRPGRVGAQRAVPRRMRDAAVGDEELVVSYAMPFTQACHQCHDGQRDPVGVVQVAVARTVAQSAFTRFHLLYAGSLAVAFGALAVLVFFATNRMVARPVARLARLMRRAEQGDFLARARVEGNDELGDLSMAFNQMLRAITNLKASEIEREGALKSAQAQVAMKKQLEDAAERLQLSNTALQRRVQGQSLLMEAAHRLGSTLDKGALVERLARLVADNLGRSDFAVWLVRENEHGEPVLQVGHAAGALDRPDVMSASFAVGEGVVGLVAETGAPVLVSDLADPPSNVAELRGKHLPLAAGSLLCAPMLHKGRVVGVLTFYAASAHSFDSDDVALLQALGAQAAMAVVNADLYQQTLELSVTDALTGLMNRRALNRILDAELVRAQRFTTPLVVLMLDVDHFKHYNDRMGHLLGDEALRAVAQALGTSIRKVDAVARFGGEEFCVILPRTDEAAGLDVAEKLLRAVRAQAVPGAEGQPLGRLSISVGLAVYPDDMPPAIEGSPVEVLLDTADKAAYEAKQRGRDRVVLAADLAGRKRRPKLDEPSRPEKAKLPS